MGLTCLIAPTPKARHTKAQLQRELEAARTLRSINRGDGPRADGGESPALFGLGSSETEPGPLSNVAGITPVSIPADASSACEPASLSAAHVQLQPVLDVGGDDSSVLVDVSQCSPQLLDRQEISSVRIKECFQR